MAAEEVPAAGKAKLGVVAAAVPAALSAAVAPPSEKPAVDAAGTVAAGVAAAALEAGPDAVAVPARRQGKGPFDSVLVG